MRIGIDARMWGPEQTGIGRFIDRLLYHIVQIDHGHELVLFALEDETPLLSNHLAGIASTASLPRIIPVRDRWYGWGEQVRFLRIVNSFNLDLLHVPHFNVPFLYRRRFVATIHDLTPWFYPGHKMGRSLLRRFLFRKVFRSTCRRATRLMSVSNATRRDIQRFVGDCNIDVVYEGPGAIDLDEPRRDDEFTSFSLGSPFIFALGVWREHKNFERLISAFEVLKKDSNWRDLLLVIGGSWEQGDPNLKQRLKDSSVRHDIITPGFLSSDAVLQWYHNARAVVVPSLAEGFGFVGLEAMHFSTPVVAARAGSLSEVYGDAAHYVDPNDAFSIAHGIDRVLRDSALRSILVARGKDQVRRYSWRRMTEKILSIYEEVARS